METSSGEIEGGSWSEPTSSLAGRRRSSSSSLPPSGQTTNIISGREEEQQLIIFASIRVEEEKGEGEIRAEPLIPPTFNVRGARMEA